MANNAIQCYFSHAQDTILDQLEAMPSVNSLMRASTALLSLGAQYARAGNTMGCPSNSPLSCSSSSVSNTCCTNSPGGLLLQTQFWDYNPETGPLDSWTVHGLWPDNCDGTYQQFCDSNREYTNITSILQSYGQTSLLSYMNTYWKDYQGRDFAKWPFYAC